MEQYEWTPTSVTFPDFSGNVELDFKMTGHSIFAQIGLDEDKWSVIGLEWDGGESFAELAIVAVEKKLFVEGQGDQYPKIAKRLGHIPATRFKVHDVDPAWLLKAITHSFGMQLRSRGIQGYPVQITNHADIPDQN